ncbi:hypothetical protein FOA52_004712 [Chlamydomonas sp. UWO 241]|nr:hypothetical protein FOA52_004712 [Chlamydomonas sp. UWO 241]
MSFNGVHSGWATGVAHDVKPNIPGPWKPAGGDLVVSLGWLDCTASMKHSQFPIDLESDQDYRVWGALMTGLNAAAALVVLAACVSAAAAHIKPLAAVLPDHVTSPPIEVVRWGVGGAGASVLLLSFAFYIGLAIGTHNSVREQLDKVQIDVSMWPLPSWASIGAFAAGGCLLTAAHLLPDGDDFVSSFPPLLGGV